MNNTQHRFLGTIGAFVMLLSLPLSVFSAAIDTVSGYITLQVEENGEAWYIAPQTQQRYFLNRPDDAFAIMRALGVGISNEDLARIPASGTPWNGPSDIMNSVRGKILLQVEENGEAWYVYPGDNRRYYLGRPADAFDVMRELGLGITTADLTTITEGTVEIDDEQLTEEPKKKKKKKDKDSGDSNDSPGSDDSDSSTETIEDYVENPYTSGQIPSTAIQELEQATFDEVNAYRKQQGQKKLKWNNDIAEIARKHSVNMATGAVEFGHDGFSERANAITTEIPVVKLVGENVAWLTTRDNMAEQVTNLWINSPGHEANIVKSGYQLSGMGVAEHNGRYYFTQLFAGE